MRVSPFTLLLCLLVSQSKASIDVAPKLEARDPVFGGRNLIQTSKGIWIDQSYIATGESQQVCDELILTIEKWKANNAPTLRTVADDGSDDMISAVSIHENCYLSFTGPEALVQFVRAQPGVIDIDLDVVVNATASNPPSWGLNRIDQPNLPLSKGVPFSPAFTGVGVNVYVIDTGVKEDHAQFAVPGGSRARTRHSEISSEKDTDLNGHGTHCSGTVGGSTFGVAPSATIIGVKVLSGSGSGSTTGVINGIKWAVNHQESNFKGTPAVFSMSLGGGLNSAMNNAVNDAVKAGHIVVVAAGNEGQQACSHSPASAGGRGAAGGVISVGATTSSDSRSSFSNYGACVDIFAPGSSITSAWIRSATDYNTISGTSMATPHVAGVAAVLLQKNGMNRDAAQAELFEIAVKGKVKDSKYAQSNLLLQVPVYTGPPTPPTLSPTLPPTLPPPTLCIGSTCVDFAESRFGPEVQGSDTVYSGPLAVTGTLCSQTKDNFSGKIVLVSRGDCAFVNKVRNAEKQGAKAVILHMINKDSIFAPTGTGTVGIPSCMVSLDSANKLKKLSGKTVIYGSSVSTSACDSLSRSRCRKAKECRYGRPTGAKSNKCYPA